MGLAVDQVAEILERFENRHIVVSPGQCSRVRHRRSTCSRCSDVCPAGALSWEGVLHVDAERCGGCGICATVCPTGALEVQSPKNAELMTKVQRTVKEQGSVTFLCPQAGAALAGGADRVLVSCIGRLDESILVDAAAHGAASIWLVDSACVDCRRMSGRQVAGLVAERANRLLAAFGSAPCIAFRHDLPAEGQRRHSSQEVGAEVSRRGLFKVLARESARLGAASVEPGFVRQDGPPAPGVATKLAAQVPEKRLLLLAALKRLGQPVAPVMAIQDNGHLAGLALTEECTGCQMCAFFCPTGALVKVEEEGQVGIGFRAALCTDCGLCRDICYRDAAQRLPRVDLNEVLALSTDWLLVQAQEAPPWQTPAAERVAAEILSSLGL